MSGSGYCARRRTGDDGMESMTREPPGMAVHEARMRMALRQARLAAEAGEVPVGAVIFNSGELAGQAWNQTQLLKDPTAHAEMLAITQAASAAGDWRLVDSILYVTKEPCPMCAGAMVHARVARVVFGAVDPRAGAAGTVFNLLQSTTLNHCAEVSGGVLSDACGTLLRDFFRARRLKPAANTEPVFSAG